MTTVIVVLSINGWMVYARVTRGAVLSVKERGYVEAARFLAGCLLLRHRKLVQAEKQAKVRARVKKAQGRSSSTISCSTSRSTSSGHAR